LILPDALKVDICFGYSIEDVEVQYLGLNPKDMDFGQSSEVRFLDYICVCNIERFLLVEFVVNQMDFL
jgi:hypothetical protein